MAVDSQPFGIAPAGYRLPPATRVGRVRLQVRDLQRSLEYYTQVLGLRTLGTNGGVALLGTHGDPRPLVELHERTDARPVPRHGLLGLYHFALLLPDTSAASAERILEDIRAQVATTEAPLRLAGDIHACSGGDCDCLRHLAVRTMPASAAHPVR